MEQSLLDLIESIENVVGNTEMIPSEKAGYIKDNIDSNTLEEFLNWFKHDV